MKAEEAFARGDADGDDRLGGGALCESVQSMSNADQRKSRSQPSRIVISERTWITPAPTIPSLHQLWSSPSSLATQSVTFDSSSVQAGEQSQLNLDVGGRIRSSTWRRGKRDVPWVADSADIHVGKDALEGRLRAVEQDQVNLEHEMRERSERTLAGK